MRLRSALALLTLAAVSCVASGCRGRLLRDDPQPVYCQPVYCQPVASGQTVTAAQPCAPCQPMICYPQ